MVQPIVTEGNTAYGSMVKNTSSIRRDNAVEQPIVTKGNTAYGTVGSPDQPVASFVQQQNNEQSAAGETFYEVIPTGNAAEESMYDYPKFSPEEDCHNELPTDWLPSVQQQLANVTATIPEDPDYI